MYVAGVDGCRAGWVCFKTELPSDSTSVEIVDNVLALLREVPANPACLCIDIPIGLFDRSRCCDKAARKLLGQPRGCSVFAPPCRAALAAKDYAEANAINQQRTGRGLSLQAWGLSKKIKQVDDAITPDCQRRVFEVHPEVCFWELAGGSPMMDKKKSKAGLNERLNLLRAVFPDIERHLDARPSGAGKDDILDAAVAAWTALRLHRGEAHQVCTPERDQKGLSAVISY